MLKEIRRVQRPRNMVVMENKMNSPKKYSICKRKSMKYVSDSNLQPINRTVIGYIIDNKYVSLLKETACSAQEELPYGSSVLFRNLSTDILKDFFKVFPAEDVYMIISAAG